MVIHLVVLNHNGRELLAECLPSVLRAAEASRHDCRVAVIDNASTDDSVAWLIDEHPQIEIFERPNEGLCSYNQVLTELPCQVAVLLNNDIRLAEDCVDPLVEPLLAPQQPNDRPIFATAPLCWLFDGKTYEGLKTGVGWRWGLVQATALYPGHENTCQSPGLTASAGCALAVDRQKFLGLGGFDPLYLPGRLEDLDFCFRGYQAGYQAHFVPSAVAYHRGAASFGKAFGEAGCQWLALRNTLLFQWKNLRHPLHVARHLLAIPIRLAFDWLRACRQPRSERWQFTRALVGALGRVDQLRFAKPWTRRNWGREREYFRRFDFDAMASEGASS
jgi:N-acetylglucosaminyl-diphospho-decaprenol L-rhamnosyltransferase